MTSKALNQIKFRNTSTYNSSIIIRRREAGSCHINTLMKMPFISFSMNSSQLSSTTDHTLICCPDQAWMDEGSLSSVEDEDEEISQL